MALNISGQGGEVWVGRHKLATLTTWQKSGAKLTFDTPGYINAYAAGLGAPTEVVVPVSAKFQKRYPVHGGTLDGGVFRLDLMHARTEGRTV